MQKSTSDAPQLRLAPKSASSWSTLRGPHNLTGPPHSQRPSPWLLGPERVREDQHPSAYLLGPPAGTAICRLSHHFHFPPPLKQPPSSLALEAPQPKLLHTHTPSYSPDAPLTGPDGAQKLGKSQPAESPWEAGGLAPSPSATSGSSVQPLSLRPLLPSRPGPPGAGGAGGI